MIAPKAPSASLSPIGCWTTRCPTSPRSRTSSRLRADPTRLEYGPRANRIRLVRDHQISFRLTPVQYDQVAAAAKVVGLKPAQLARMLTLRGVAQVLREDG